MPSWWPMWLPWVGVETLDAATALDVLEVPRPIRILRAEWFGRGFTIAAWDAPHG